MDKEKWNFGLAIAAIVIALMAAGFTAAQWYEARQTRIDDEKHFDIARQDAAKASSDQQAQVERSAASAERSAKSSEKSTDVAGDSLRLSRQVFQTSERAFIHVKQITFVVEPNKPAKVIVQFENVGRTTAKGTRCMANIRLGNTPLTEVPQNVLPSVLRTPMDLVAGDIRELPVATTSAVPESEINSLKSGARYLYTFGHIEYKDIFAHPHRSTFCALFSADDPSRALACPFSNTVD